MKNKFGDFFFFVSDIIVTVSHAQCIPNRMCPQNSLYMDVAQTSNNRSHAVVTIVVCCHSVKFCLLATGAFQLQHCE